MTAGTLLAFFPSDLLRRMLRFVGGLMLGLSALVNVACVALPEVETAAVQDATIVIEKHRVTPSLETPVRFDLVEAGNFFEISDAIKTTPSDLDVQISWYYDFEPGQLIETWQTCGGEARCFLTICNKPNPNAKRHHLWVVVSHGERTPKTTKPLDFQDGAVFDAVIWEIETKNACPK